MTYTAPWEDVALVSWTKITKIATGSRAGTHPATHVCLRTTLPARSSSPLRRLVRSALPVFAATGNPSTSGCRALRAVPSVLSVSPCSAC